MIFPGNASDVQGIDIVQEYEELIELATDSSRTIDTLSEAMERSRSEYYAMIGVAYTIIFLCVAGTVQFGTSPSDRYSDVLLYVAWGFIIISSFGALSISYFAFERFKKIRRTRLILATELGIHQDLMSLIDQQKRRLDNIDILSPVAKATLEMKVKRLERRKNNQS